jgi:drug/metabolite transporter (DMT)-like permease
LEASPVRYRLYLVATALLFSTGGAAIKAATLNGWQVASFRSGVAAVALLLALPQARRGWSWRVVPVAAAYAAALVLFALANRLTTAANAVFLQSTAPLYLLFLAPWLLREPVHARDLLCALAVGGGMVLLFSGSARSAVTAPDPWHGNLIGLASGLSWALTITGLRWLGRDAIPGKPHNPALATVVLGNVLAFMAAVPMALPVTSVHLSDVAVILYLGVVQIGLAYFLLTRAVSHVPAFEATVVLLLEPVMNPIWAWLVHHERPGPWALVGGAIILSAALANSWAQARR